jgi:hypothetical protein
MAFAASMKRFVARHSDPRKRLLAVLDAQAEVFSEPSFPGALSSRPAPKLLTAG